MGKSLDFDKYALKKTMKGAVSASWISAWDDFKRSSNISVSELRFLDFGAGDGRYFKFLCLDGVNPDHVHDTEISKVRVERCIQQGMKNCFLTKNNSSLPFSDSFFDFVNMVEVIEHIPEDQIEWWLSEIRRVLKPNGLLLLTTPNYPIKRFYDYIDAILGGKWGRISDDPTHVKKYSVSRLLKTIEPFFFTSHIGPYKEGFLFKRFHCNFFMHKVMVGGKRKLNLTT